MPRQDKQDNKPSSNEKTKRIKWWEWLVGGILVLGAIAVVILYLMSIITATWPLTAIALPALFTLFQYILDKRKEAALAAIAQQQESNQTITTTITPDGAILTHTATPSPANSTATIVSTPTASPTTPSISVSPSTRPQHGLVLPSATAVAVYHITFHTHSYAADGRILPPKTLASPIDVTPTTSNNSSAGNPASFSSMPPLPTSSSTRGLLSSSTTGNLPTYTPSIGSVSSFVAQMNANASMKSQPAVTAVPGAVGNSTLKSSRAMTPTVDGKSEVQPTSTPPRRFNFANRKTNPGAPAIQKVLDSPPKSPDTFEEKFQALLEENRVLKERFKKLIARMFLYVGFNPNNNPKQNETTAATVCGLLKTHTISSCSRPAKLGTMVDNFLLHGEAMPAFQKSETNSTHFKMLTNENAQCRKLYSDIGNYLVFLLNPNKTKERKKLLEQINKLAQARLKHGHHIHSNVQAVINQTLLTLNIVPTPIRPTSSVSSQSSTSTIPRKLEFTW